MIPLIDATNKSRNSSKKIKTKNLPYVFIEQFRYVTTVLYNFSTIDNIADAPGRRAPTQNVL